MRLNDLPKHYDPKQTEERWYQFWLEKGIFHADVNAKKEAFSVVIPPPNVTDVLHLGHALNRADTHQLGWHARDCKAHKASQRLEP